MLSVDFLIVDRIPYERFHASISRIPNIGETVSLAFNGSVDQYFKAVDVITAIPCNACGLQEFDAAYVVKLRRKEENKEMFDITVYSDGDQIVNKYKSQYDIILMDVEMKFMDGMSAAEEIRKIDTEVVIIFITNMAQYAIRGYAVDALDYVLKPVSYFAFSQRLNRAISRMKKRETKIIMVNMKGGMVRINVANIYYIESQGHTLILHTILGNYETTGKMKEMEEKLAEMNFCRGNKGYLINLQHVERIQDGCALVKGENLTLSRARRKVFMEALTRYWGEVIK